ncbi:hypothetical protein E2C01_024127 [Portunus trituberculatus]|uniref:Uncharacterized protein n=1 Tax=Portunus trituberculatus TaxID=210409 RepID=A0A5B7ECB8_PORTR|nr:hypothetical protein [Portunus trituberculatus]
MRSPVKTRCRAFRYQPVVTPSASLYRPWLGYWSCLASSSYTVSLVIGENLPCPSRSHRYRFLSKPFPTCYLIRGMGGQAGHIAGGRGDATPFVTRHCVVSSSVIVASVAS